MAIQTPPTPASGSPRLHEAVEAALSRSAADDRWFAITTIILTPVAMLIAVLVLTFTLHWVGSDQSRYSYDDQPGFILEISVANLIMLYLLAVGTRGSWRSGWVLAGALVYAAMLGLSYGLSVSGLALVGPWALLAILALTLVSQTHQHRIEEDTNVVALVPNLIIDAYRQILRDPWFRDRGGLDVKRAVAMIEAVRAGNLTRQKRLCDAAAQRGVNLRERLIRAKLLREYRGQLRLGDAVPGPADSPPPR